MMTDEQFIDAALDEQSPETLAAVRAALTAQSILGVRFDPRRVEEFADQYNAPRGPVLALLGHVIGRQPGSRACVFSADYAARADSHDSRLALGAALTLARTIGTA